MKFLKDFRDFYIGLRPKMAQAIENVKKNEAHAFQTLCSGSLNGLQVDTLEGRHFCNRLMVTHLNRIGCENSRSAKQIGRHVFNFIFKPHIFFSEYKDFIQVQGDLSVDVARSVRAIALKNALYYRTAQNRDIVDVLYFERRRKVMENPNWQQVAKAEYVEEVLGKHSKGNSGCQKQSNLKMSPQKSCNMEQKEMKNGIGDVNLEKMTGADKWIEGYERMVGNLFVGATMTPEKVATHIGGMPLIDNQNIRK